MSKNPKAPAVEQALIGVTADLGVTSADSAHREIARLQRAEFQTAADKAQARLPKGYTIEVTETWKGLGFTLRLPRR